MEKQFRIVTVKTTSVSEIEVSVSFEGGGAIEKTRTFTLQKEVSPGTSPKEFVYLLVQDLAEYINRIPEWVKEAKISESMVEGLQHELETRLFANEDFRYKFKDQFDKIVLINNFKIHKKSVIITYAEVSPLELQRGANSASALGVISPEKVDTIQYPLKGYKNSERFMSQLAKLLGKSVDNIWIVDRLSLKNAVMRYMYSRKRKREKVMVFISSFLLFCLFVYGITKYDYISNIEYGSGKTDIEVLENRLLCFRVALEEYQQNNVIEDAVLNELRNMDLLLKGFSKRTSEENIQFLTAEIERFKEKINKRGIDLNHCQ